MSDITDTTTAPADAADTTTAPADTTETAAVTDAADVTEATDAADDADATDTADVADTADATDTADVADTESVEESTTADDSAAQGATADATTDDAKTETEDSGGAEVRPRRRNDSPYDRPGKWYVIHTQSGYENKVRNNLLARTQSMNMEERIFEVVIPLEDVVEFKNGKKVIVQKKVFPGYLLCRMHLDDDSWFVVRNTPGVTGFIGAGNKPSPLPRKDVENFLATKEDGDEPSRKGRPRLEYSMGETVRVKEGPFADFQGEIVEINEDQLRLKVLVNIFGRETPVELQFAEVAKI
jgi:transcriptional antiterminator NusG